MNTVIKDPQAKLPYGHDWSEWLNAGDKIASSSWTVPTGLTLVAHGKTDTTTEAVLSGGVDEEIYYCINHIHTNLGYEDDRTIKFVMKQR